MTALIRIDRQWTPPGQGDRSRPIRFCSRCGHPSEEPAGGMGIKRRVCRSCGMGLLLACGREALPGEAGAFAIVTFDLAISAVSKAGERVLGKEAELSGSHLLDVLTSPLGDDQLARHVSHAAQRETEPVVMPVRLQGKRSRKTGTMAARIATCGPPRAALVVVEPSEFGRR
jgi:hypothetical protein